MTKSGFGTYSLFPAIIFWGTLIGAIVYSHTAFLPAYLSDLPNSAIVVTGKYAVNEAPFWQTIHPLLILSLIAALALNWKFEARRRLIALTCVIYVCVLAVTAVYFLPELLAFAKSPESNLPASEWLARGHRWLYLSMIRGAVCFIGFVPLLAALAKPESEKSNFA
ncbi:MAG TPA: hypothetical protein VIL74_10495 [Pyrinomonadaceae bacterium]|jgi:uncharacterized membrane protein